mmetsp:Transcript_5871/g.10080  ORF Transcript_5871/g.10080 Transcript_5871/m.10080 type:complete len:99 (+) Transcript_5871:136-432(+)
MMKEKSSCYLQPTQNNMKQIYSIPTFIIFEVCLSSVNKTHPYLSDQIHFFSVQNQSHHPCRPYHHPCHLDMPHIPFYPSDGAPHALALDLASPGLGMG